MLLNNIGPERASYVIVLFPVIAIIIQSLWAAPFLGWVLLVSSWTKRKPVLVAMIPLAVISFAEFYYYRTKVFFDLVTERIVGWLIPVDFDTGLHIGSNEQMTGQSTLYENAPSLLTLPDFWYGLVVTAVMVAGAVYIRRYRDES